MKNIVSMKLSIVDSDNKEHALNHDLGNQGAIEALRDIAVFLARALSGVPSTKAAAMLTEESIALTNKAAAISSDSPHPTVLDFGRTIKR